MKFISYAQNYEDVMLWRALKHIEKGTYIDVGANSPNQESVTKAFYERGWRGINIEPVSSWFEMLRRERVEDTNLQLAVSDSQGELTFFEVIDTGLSTLRPDIAARHLEEKRFQLCEYQVPTRTLTQIYHEHDCQDVHFLKIDVEGSEKSVLQGIDFSVVRPWIIVIESTLPNTQVENHLDWEHLILTQNYHFVYFDGLNRFYIDDTHSELDASFLTPPNYWDQFISYREVELTVEYNRLQGQSQGLSNQNQALTEQNQALTEQNQALAEQNQGLTEQIYLLERKLQDVELNHEKEVRSLHEINQDLDAKNIDLCAQTSVLNNEICRLNNYIEHLHQEITDLDQYRAKLAEQIELLTQDTVYWQDIANQRFNELQLIYSSRSWKLAWPLRQSSKLIHLLETPIKKYGQNKQGSSATSISEQSNVLREDK